MWSPSFESHVRPDGERRVPNRPRVGRSVPGVRGGPGPSEHRAVLRPRPERVLHGGGQGAHRGDAEGRDGLRDRATPSTTGCRERRPDRRWSSGLSAATIKRRLAAVSSFYGYLITRDDVDVTVNPVPRGIATRQSRSRSGRGLPLVRGVRRLPRILDPTEVEALMGALRTDRDRAMVQAMVLGGLRRCEVLGLRLGDLRLGEWRVLIREGKGGHERLVPLSPTFFATVARYMNDERPTRVDDRLAVRLAQRAAPGPTALDTGTRRDRARRTPAGRPQPRHLP